MIYNRSVAVPLALRTGCVGAESLWNAAPSWKYADNPIRTCPAAVVSQRNGISGGFASVSSGVHLLCAVWTARAIGAHLSRWFSARSRCVVRNKLPLSSMLEHRPAFTPRVGECQENRSERQPRLPYNERLPEPLVQSRSPSQPVSRGAGYADAQLQANLVQLLGARKTQSLCPNDLGALPTGPLA